MELLFILSILTFIAIRATGVPFNFTAFIITSVLMLLVWIFFGPRIKK